MLLPIAARPRAAIVALLVACGGGDGSRPSPDAAATGGGGATETTDGGVAGASGSAGAAAARPFWCSDYRSDVGGGIAASGWIRLAVAIPGRGAGAMTSPIVECRSDGHDWSVSAHGTEQDGVDETAMSLRISGAFHGPGRYTGTIAQGLTASLSHDDLGPTSFQTTPFSECDLCINDDGLSGTVRCWGLESPAGSTLQTAYVDDGSFTCVGAQAKPAQAPTDPTIPRGLDATSVLCHYLDKLACPGHPPGAACDAHVTTLTLDGPCRTQWSQWFACIGRQRPSLFRCGSGDELEVTSGACGDELTALRQCRAMPTGGAGGATGGATTSPQCDAFCAKLASKCQLACDRAIDCVVLPNQCLASTLASLRCAAEGDHLACAQGGYTVAGCLDQSSLCQ